MTRQKLKELIQEVLDEMMNDGQLGELNIAPLRALGASRTARKVIPGLGAHEKRERAKDADAMRIGFLQDMDPLDKKSSAKDPAYQSAVKHFTRRRDRFLGKSVTERLKEYIHEVLQEVLDTPDSKKAYVKKANTSIRDLLTKTFEKQKARDVAGSQKLTDKTQKRMQKRAAVEKEL
jgi:hypothetical protein